jgi:glycosyltransferase involved in cell wall biosynthesis
MSREPEAIVPFNFTTKTPKVLAWCDSPTVTTGFARVAKNVLTHWHHLGIVAECWGIHFDGWFYDQVPFRMLPGGSGDWNSPRRLTQFLNVLDQGDYTHVWMLNDPDALSGHGFPAKLREVCAKRNVRTMLYFPVDAPLEREWLGMVEAVTVPVTFTQYGRAQTQSALGRSLFPIGVVPHGVDEVFKPLGVEDRKLARQIELQVQSGKAEIGKPIQFVEPDDLLLLNVNKNEWRKDPLRSLEILAGLRALGVPAKLILRMDPTSAMGGVQLDLAAKQLGLTYGKEWCHIGPVPDEGLLALYNAADLYLTTSLGEGWGLGVTEAMACHCPVAMAKHTSLEEIGKADAGGPIWLPMEPGAVCGADTRIRHRVDLEGAVQAIHHAWEQGQCGNGVRCHPALGHLKRWDWVAEELLKLMGILPTKAES